jgi:hypothetical protein
VAFAFAAEHAERGIMALMQPNPKVRADEQSADSLSGDGRPKDGVRYADKDEALRIADKLADRWSDLLERLAR